MIPGHIPRCEGDEDSEGDDEEDDDGLTWDYSFDLLTKCLSAVPFTTEELEEFVHEEFPQLESLLPVDPLDDNHLVWDAYMPELAPSDDEPPLSLFYDCHSQLPSPETLQNSSSNESMYDYCRPPTKKSSSSQLSQNTSYRSCLTFWSVGSEIKTKHLLNSLALRPSLLDKLSPEARKVILNAQKCRVRNGNYSSRAVDASKVQQCHQQDSEESLTQSEELDLRLKKNNDIKIYVEDNSSKETGQSLNELGMKVDKETLCANWLASQNLEQTIASDDDNIDLSSEECSNDSSSGNTGSQNRSDVSSLEYLSSKSYLTETFSADIFYSCAESSEFATSVDIEYQEISLDDEKFKFYLNISCIDTCDCDCDWKQVIGPVEGIADVENLKSEVTEDKIIQDDKRETSAEMISKQSFTDHGQNETEIPLKESCTILTDTLTDSPDRYGPYMAVEDTCSTLSPWMTTMPQGVMLPQHIPMTSALDMLESKGSSSSTLQISMGRHTEEQPEASAHASSETSISSVDLDYNPSGASMEEAVEIVQDIIYSSVSQILVEDALIQSMSSTFAHNVVQNLPPFIVGDDLQIIQLSDEQLNTRSSIIVDDTESATQPSNQQSAYPGAFAQSLTDTLHLIDNINSDEKLALMENGRFQNNNIPPHNTHHSASDHVSVDNDDVKDSTEESESDFMVIISTGSLDGLKSLAKDVAHNAINNAVNSISAHHSPEPVSQSDITTIEIDVNENDDEKSCSACTESDVQIREDDYEDHVMNVPADLQKHVLKTASFSDDMCTQNIYDNVAHQIVHQTLENAIDFIQTGQVLCECLLESRDVGSINDNIEDIDYDQMQKDDHNDIIPEEGCDSLDQSNDVISTTLKRNVVHLSNSEVELKFNHRKRLMKATETFVTGLLLGAMDELFFLFGDSQDSANVESVITEIQDDDKPSISQSEERIIRECEFVSSKIIAGTLANAQQQIIKERAAEFISHHFDSACNVASITGNCHAILKIEATCDAFVQNGYETNSNSSDEELCQAVLVENAEEIIDVIVSAAQNTILSDQASMIVKYIVSNACQQIVTDIFEGKVRNFTKVTFSSRYPAENENIAEEIVTSVIDVASKTLNDKSVDVSCICSQMDREEQESNAQVLDFEDNLYLAANVSEAQFSREMFVNANSDTQGYEERRSNDKCEECAQQSEPSILQQNEIVSNKRIVSDAGHTENVSMTNHCYVSDEIISCKESIPEKEDDIACVSSSIFSHTHPEDKENRKHATTENELSQTNLPEPCYVCEELVLENECVFDDRASRTSHVTNNSGHAFEDKGEIGVSSLEEPCYLCEEVVLENETVHLMDSDNGNHNVTDEVKQDLDSAEGEQKQMFSGNLICDIKTQSHICDTMEVGVQIVVDTQTSITEMALNVTYEDGCSQTLQYEMMDIGLQSSLLMTDNDAQTSIAEMSHYVACEETSSQMHQNEMKEIGLQSSTLTAETNTQTSSTEMTLQVTCEGTSSQTPENEMKDIGLQSSTLMTEHDTQTSVTEMSHCASQVPASFIGVQSLDIENKIGSQKLGSPLDIKHGKVESKSENLEQRGMNQAANDSRSSDITYASIPPNGDESKIHVNEEGKLIDVCTQYPAQEVEIVRQEEHLSVSPQIDVITVNVSGSQQDMYTEDTSRNPKQNWLMQSEETLISVPSDSVKFSFSDAKSNLSDKDNNNAVTFMSSPCLTSLDDSPALFPEPDAIDKMDSKGLPFGITSLPESEAPEMYVFTIASSGVNADGSTYQLHDSDTDEEKCDPLVTLLKSSPDFLQSQTAQSSESRHNQGIVLKNTLSSVDFEIPQELGTKSSQKGVAVTSKTRARSVHFMGEHDDIPIEISCSLCKQREVQDSSSSSTTCTSTTTSSSDATSSSSTSSMCDDCSQASIQNSRSTDEESSDSESSAIMEVPRKMMQDTLSEDSHWLYEDGNSFVGPTDEPGASAMTETIDKGDISMRESFASYPDEMRDNPSDGKMDELLQICRKISNASLGTDNPMEQHVPFPSLEKMQVSHIDPDNCCKICQDIYENERNTTRGISISEQTILGRGCSNIVLEARISEAEDLGLCSSDSSTCRTDGECLHEVDTEMSSISPYKANEGLISQTYVNDKVDDSRTTDQSKVGANIANTSSEHLAGIKDGLWDLKRFILGFQQEWQNVTDEDHTAGVNTTVSCKGYVNHDKAHHASEIGKERCPEDKNTSTDDSATENNMIDTEERMKERDVLTNQNYEIEEDRPDEQNDAPEWFDAEEIMIGNDIENQKPEIEEKLPDGQRKSIIEGSTAENGRKHDEIFVRSDHTIQKAIIDIEELQDGEKIGKQHKSEIETEQRDSQERITVRERISEIEKKELSNEENVSIHYEAHSEIQVPDTEKQILKRDDLANHVPEHRTNINNKLETNIDRIGADEEILINDKSTKQQPEIEIEAFPDVERISIKDKPDADAEKTNGGKILMMKDDPVDNSLREPTFEKIMPMTDALTQKASCTEVTCDDINAEENSWKNSSETPRAIENVDIVQASSSVGMAHIRSELETIKRDLLQMSTVPCKGKQDSDKEHSNIHSGNDEYEEDLYHRSPEDLQNVHDSNVSKNNRSCSRCSSVNDSLSALDSLHDLCHKWHQSSSVMQTVHEPCDSPMCMHANEFNISEAIISSSEICSECGNSEQDVPSSKQLEYPKQSDTEEREQHSSLQIYLKAFEDFHENEFSGFDNLDQGSETFQYSSSSENYSVEQSMVHVKESTNDLNERSTSKLHIASVQRAMTDHDSSYDSLRNFDSPQDSPNHCDILNVNNEDPEMVVYERMVFLQGPQAGPSNAGVHVIGGQERLSSSDQALEELRFLFNEIARNDQEETDRNFSMQLNNDVQASGDGYMGITNDGFGEDFDMLDEDMINIQDDVLLRLRDELPEEESMPMDVESDMPFSESQGSLDLDAIEADGSMMSGYLSLEDIAVPSSSYDFYSREYQTENPSIIEEEHDELMKSGHHVASSQHSTNEGNRESKSTAKRKSRSMSVTQVYEKVASKKVCFQTEQNLEHYEVIWSRTGLRQKRIWSKSLNDVPENTAVVQNDQGLTVFFKTDSV